MGKKSRRSKRGETEEEEEGSYSESESFTSSRSGTEATGSPRSPSSPQVLVTEEDVITYIENLGEKSSRLRDQALSYLNVALSNYVCVEAIGSRVETLARNLQRIIKNSGASNAERCSACKTLAMLALVFGDHGDLLSSACGDLSLVVRDASTPDAVVAIGLSALGILSFMDPNVEEESASHSSNSLQVFLEKFTTNVSHQDPKITEAALESWGLLLSRGNITQESYHILKSTRPTLETLLDRENGDVVVAAAENIAMLFEHHHEQEGKTDKGLLERLDELANDTYKTSSKESRKLKRSALKRALSTVATGESPSESIMVSGHSLEFDNWISIKQVSAFRNILGHGLTKHLASNQVIRSILGITLDIASSKKKTKSEKKEIIQMSSQADKEKTVKYSKTRRERFDVHSED